MERGSVMSSHHDVLQSCSRQWRLLLFHVKRSLNLWFVVVAVGLLGDFPPYGVSNGAGCLDTSGHGAQPGVP